MPEKPSLALAMKKLQSLRDRFERLEKDIGALKDLLNVHDNWNSTVRKWIGQRVVVSDRANLQNVGKLLWSDRYNLCVETDYGARVYTKGGINWIELAR